MWQDRHPARTLEEQYNFYETSPPPEIWPYVSDLKLKAFYQRRTGDGMMRMEMSKEDDTFVAEFAPGKVRLMKHTDNADTVIAEKDWNAPNRPAEIEFTNVDYRVAIRIDGEDVIATAPQQYAPNVAELLADHRSGKLHQRPRVSLYADKQKATLSHVSLWRDVYYTSRDSRQQMLWGLPENPVELGPDEFFVMGDNSSNSQDARYWERPIDLKAHEDLEVQGGRVPARFMLGKAFFVYWPAGLKLLGWGLVPNVGEMRFIH
jgi:hypothetical protein